MIALVAGLFAIFAAVAVVVLLVLPARAPDPERPALAWRELRRRAVASTDRMLRRHGWVDAGKLDLAGVTWSAGAFTLVVALAAAAAAGLGVLIAVAQRTPAAWALPVVFAIATVLIARLQVEQRIGRRRTRFAEQLEDTLQLIAGGLRAGHSLPRAIDAVAREAESPTAEEFTRIVNEHRLGRDIDEALLAAADRMKSDDLAWTAQAVAIHRDIGGNLSELLDHVADTVRERQQIRRQVQTLSAEGRVSAIVLMVLPIVVAVLLSVISPSYLAMFVTTPLGFALLGLSVLLFIVGGIWMRAITRISY